MTKWGKFVALRVPKNETIGPENRSLNIIRSLAALAVVLGHVRLLLFVDYPDASHDPVTSLLYAFTSMGNLSVIVFFVLSGYWVGGGVISRLRRGSFKWGSYASSRLTRLWLVLIPALFLTFVVDQIGRLALPNSDIYARGSLYVGVPETVSYSLSTFLGNMFFLQGIHVTEYGLDMPLWSLAFEFWYYVMFPAAMVACWPGRGRVRRITAIAVLAGSAAVAGEEVLVLFPAWLAGAAVAAYRDQAAQVLGKLSATRVEWLRFGAVLLVLGTMIIVRQSHLPWRTGEWLVAAAASLLLLVCIRDVPWSGRIGKVLDHASNTAHFSYSLYATHMPLVAVVAAVFVPEFALRWQMDVVHVAWALGAVAILIVFAVGFAKATEERTDIVRKWIHNRLGAGRAARITKGFQPVPDQLQDMARESGRC